jgi:hypothetical protein
MLLISHLTDMRIEASGDLVFFCGSPQPTYKVSGLILNDKILEGYSTMPISEAFRDAHIGMFRGVPIDVYHDHERGTYDNGAPYCINMVGAYLE